MTSPFGSTSAVKDSDKSKFGKRKSKNRHSFHFIAKHLADKQRCSKVLKRKLKKYKLRHDGQEDQDVLDVTETLVSSLTFKCAKKTECKEQLSDEWRPKNYLFKMVRKRKTELFLQNSSRCEKENPDVTKSNDVDESDSSNSILCGSQEKKHTDAFKLLMDSRNKSIGMNSPGKDKPDDQSETIANESKSIKAKRMLVLQKMAEAKGSLKKKELEEFQEECIKKKLEKRAQNFKNMLLHQETKLPIKQESTKIIDTVSDANKVEETPGMKNDRALQIINIFEDSEIEANASKTNKKTMSKEDEEFLRKLSPSIKKKENMLCYFKKVEKEPVSLVESESENVVIKVKLAPKSKKKIKKKKDSHKEITKSDQTMRTECTEDTMIVETPEPTKDKKVENGTLVENKSKRKRNFKEIITTAQTAEKGGTVTSTEERPKRNIKKPVKYKDDLFPSSSDEELHIFTPKKKKRSEANNNSEIISTGKTVHKVKTKVIEKQTKQEVKKDVPLAPIFNTKRPPNSIDIEAKQKFLQSGVPEQIKKLAAQQKLKDVFVDYFQPVVHVQQNDNATVEKRTDLVVKLDLSEATELDEMSPIEGFYKKMLNNLQLHRTVEEQTGSKNIKTILQHMKSLKPNFPVYRTYRLLRDKKRGEFKDNSYLNLDNSIEALNGIIDISNENPDQLSWTDKYRPTSTNQIIGNFETNKELKKWLITWKENQLKSKQRLNADSDSSDFYNSDNDSRDTLKNGNNLVILTGPVGSGKTSSVYAVATELAIKVIEVNVSTKRTGKIMLQDLQEATQSHKVNRAASSSENSQKTQENKNLNLPKKRGRKPKKNMKKNQKSPDKKQSLSLSQNSQELRTDSSLILIDDADIVFEQDDGFSSAIVQIVQSSKRPVILVTTTLSCQHLQRFIQSGKILKYRQLMPRLLGPWLDVMCLVENGSCSPGIGATFLDYFKGDIRKTINFLQFYKSSEVKTVSNDSQTIDIKTQIDIDDEKSGMSWADHDEIEAKQGKTMSNVNNNYMWHEFQHKHLVTDDNILNIWWSLPQIMSVENDSKKLVHSIKDDCCADLTSFATVMDSISIADYIHSQKKYDVNITCKPWHSNESHTVLENENLDKYSSSNEGSWEISLELMRNSLANSRKKFNMDYSYDISFPGMSIQRQRDVVVSRHTSLSSCINPSAVLDRKSVALDYWSSCRRICSIEKTKTDSNSKRNNRFCHYLKSANVPCKSDFFENLGDSLNFHKTLK